MQFLIDEDLPRSTGNLLRRYGHEAIDVRDIGLRGAKDSQIASYAQSRGLCLVTGDFDFSDIRNYPPAQYAGLVVLSIPRDAAALFILNFLLLMYSNFNLPTKNTKHTKSLSRILA